MSWIKLKDEDGHLRLVNLSNAQSIVPGGKNRIRVIWKHDELVEVDHNDLPNDSCVYSEQVFVDISIQQVEMLLRTNFLMIDSLQNKMANGEKQTPPTDSKPEPEQQTPPPPSLEERVCGCGCEMTFKPSRANQKYIDEKHKSHFNNSKKAKENN